VVSAAVAAAALASATVVRADGMDRGPAPYVSGLSWSGIYIGIQSGWMDSDISGHLTSAPSTGLHFKAEPDGGSSASIWATSISGAISSWGSKAA
jgi:hypothetical protein